MQIAKILERLVECGRTDDYLELDNQFPNREAYQSFTQLLMAEIKGEQGSGFMHYYEIFTILGDKYDFDTLLFLIKGLAIIEKKSQLNGSVSPIIPLYKKLVEKSGFRYLLTADKASIYLLIKHLEEQPNHKIEYITHWLLSNSDNDYLPFGTATLRSKTLPEIKFEIETWIHRKQSVASRDKIEKEVRELNRAIVVENQKKLHQEKNKQQRELREHLNTLTISELLHTIHSDKKRAIYFYTCELKKIKNEELTSKDKVIIKEILHRFKHSETGQFKRLKEILLSIVE